MYVSLISSVISFIILLKRYLYLLFDDSVAYNILSKIYFTSVQSGYLLSILVNFKIQGGCAVPSLKLPICSMIFKKASWIIGICSIAHKIAPGKLVFVRRTDILSWKTVVHQINKPFWEIVICSIVKKKGF